VPLYLLLCEVWKLQKGVVSVPHALNYTLGELDSGDGGQEESLLIRYLNDALNQLRGNIQYFIELNFHFLFDINISFHYTHIYIEKKEIVGITLPESDR
jgi:hypothetical protein